MRRILAVLAVSIPCVALCPLSMRAAETTEAPATTTAPATTQHTLTPQQQRMKDCNKQAGEKGLSGTARKTFMKDCLSTKGHADSPAAAPETPKQ